METSPCPDITDEQWRSISLRYLTPTFVDILALSGDKINVVEDDACPVLLLHGEIEAGVDEAAPVE